MTAAHTFYSPRVAKAEKGDLSWMSSALCRGSGVDFFPTSRGSAPVDYATPLAVCHKCPVQDQCRSWATTAGDIGRDGYTNHGQVVGGCGPKVKKPVGRPVQECGTRAGYMRHWRQGEPYCDPCRAANAVHTKAKAEKKKAL